MSNKLRIKEVLREKHLSINDLANEMGINRVTLSNIIKGNPTVDTLSKIARSLNVPIRELFCEEEENMGKIFRWDSIREEYVFSAFNEHISLNANFKDLYITLSLSIHHKDIEVITSSLENKAFFEKFLQPDLDIKDYFLKIAREGAFIVRILSLQTSLTLFEFESMIKAFELFRKIYLDQCIKQKQ